MLVVISPSKTLDYTTPSPTEIHSLPRFLDDSTELMRCLKQLTSTEVSNLMSISNKLGHMNFGRYSEWHPEFTLDNAKQCILAFKGDVYTGLDVDSLSLEDLKWAQNHIRVLSGLYGVLRPLDLMQPYRLEMGTKFSTNRGKNLYEFWGTKITKSLNQHLEQNSPQVLVNLASNEYFKAIKPELLQADVVTPVFKDWKGGKYKIISFFAKKARGMMSRFIIQHQIDDPHQIKLFNSNGYKFDKSASTEKEWIFTRKLME